MVESSRQDQARLRWFRPRTGGFRIGRTRLGPVLAVAALAPITAELMQAYLSDIGGVFGLVFVVAFFAPLYGGAALLIREIAVRTGRGWPGRLLLATAFGVAMPTLVDASLFTVSRPDIDDWDQIVTGASVGGIGWAAALGWVAGHVLMSVSAPLVIVEALVRERRPWLGRFGLAVTVVLMLLVAGFVHHDTDTINDVRAGVGRYGAAAVLVIALALTAMTPIGRPVPRAPGRASPSLWWCPMTGVVVIAVLALAPKSWLGLAVVAAVLVAGGLLVLAWSRSPSWGPRHLAALAFGGVLTQTLIGFLAPLPQQTTWAEKLTQNILYLLLVLALGVALERRTRARGDQVVRPPERDASAN